MKLTNFKAWNIKHHFVGKQGHKFEVHVKDIVRISGRLNSKWSDDYCKFPVEILAFGTGNYSYNPRSARIPDEMVAKVMCTMEACYHHKNTPEFPKEFLVDVRYLLEINDTYIQRNLNWLKAYQYTYSRFLSLKYTIKKQKKERAVIIGGRNSKNKASKSPRKDPGC